MQVVKGKHKFKADLSGAALSREAPRPHTRTVDLLDGSLRFATLSQAVR